MTRSLRWRRERARRRLAMACLRVGDMAGFDRHAGVLQAIEVCVGCAVRRQGALEIYKSVPIWEVRAQVRRGWSASA